jgi:hypothetical protein
MEKESTLEENCGLLHAARTKWNGHSKFVQSASQSGET